MSTPRTRPLRTCRLLWALLALLLALPAQAQDDKKADAQADAKSEKADAKKTAEKTDDAKKPEQLVAFVGGRVLTGTGRVHAPGVVVVTDGVITAVGRQGNVEIPEGAETIDASGHWLVPGMVVPSTTRIGLKGRGDWADRFNRFDPELELMQAVGVTAFYTSDGNSPTRPSDKNAVYRVVRDKRTKDVVVKSGVAVEMNVAAARPSQLRQLEKVFADAREYIAAMEKYHAAVEQWKKDLAAWEKREAEREKKAKAAAEAAAKLTPEQKKKAEEAKQKAEAEAKKKAEEAAKKAKKEGKPAPEKPAPKKDEKPKAPTPPKASAAVKLMAKVLEAELPLRVRGQDRGQLRRIVALCRQHKLRNPIIDDCGEGWTMTPDLASVGARAIVAPRARFAPRFEGDENSGWTIENAHRLDKGGVPVALTTPSTGFAYWGITGDDMLTFRLCAAFAVRGGMSNQHALAGVTSRAAEILGVGDQIGSLSKGRKADIVWYSADPLHYRSLVERVYMGGRLQYERSKSTWLRHLERKGQ